MGCRVCVPGTYLHRVEMDRNYLRGWPRGEDGLVVGVCRWMASLPSREKNEALLPRGGGWLQRLIAAAALPRFGARPQWRMRAVEHTLVRAGHPAHVDGFWLSIDTTDK
jgi:hypothetical protein